MKTLKTILFSVLAVLAIPSFAAWTIVSEGSNPQVTDGNWVIQLNSQKKAKFVSKADGGSTVLDMTTLNADLAAAGSTYKCTEFDTNGFRGSTYSILKTELTEIYFPDEVTKIGQQCFQNCNALVTVELGSSFNSFANSHGFSQCHSLMTLYTRGEEKVVGTIKLPDVVSSLPNYTFENCNSYSNMIARGVKKIGQATFYQNATVRSIELSPELYSVTSGNDHGTMYQCWNITNFYPSVMTLTDNIGQSSFRELPLDHDLDFSSSTFTSVASASFYGIKLAIGCRITLPATLQSVGSNAFRQQQNGRTSKVEIRFLGEVPSSLGEDCFTPRQNYHNIFYVDAKKCTSWTATGFTPLTEEMKSDASYPGEKTLGKSTIGVNQSGWWNWLVQEDLPKGPTEWNVVSENNDGSITIYNKVDTWTFNLIPDGNGAYLVKYVSDELAADATVELELVKISDDLELEIAGLAAEAFKGVTKISKLVLPTGADYMGDYALEGCTGLQELILPSGFDYDEAGKGAFKGCSSLSIVGLSTQSISAGVVVLPDSVTSVTEELFAGCTSITTISGKNVATIGANAFANASALNRVTFSKDLGALTFGEGAFKGTALTQTIDLRETPMTKIPASAFENCRGISLVIVPASVTEIGASAFANMADGAAISFEGGVPTLGTNALEPPSAVAGSRYNIRIEDENKAAWQANGFTAITDSMMEESDYYTSFYIGQTTLGTSGGANWMFCKDPSKTWWISGVGTYKRPDNNQTFTTKTVTDGTYIMHVFTDGKNQYLAPDVCVEGGILDMTTLDVDTGLAPVALHTKAFSKYFEKTPAVVRLPDSMTSVGYQAFHENKKIVEVELGAGITTLGDSPFRECVAFSTMYQRGTAERIEGQVNIPASITALSAGAEFFNCDGIKEVIAPAVVVVGHSTFYECSSVTNIVLSPEIYEFKGGGQGAFYQCKSLKTISPKEMKLVATGSGTFRELRLSHGLDLSKSTFTTVGDKAFYATKCSDENGFACPMVMPKTVTKLDGQAFWGQNGNGKQIIVFKGDKPTSVQSNSLDTNNNGLNTLVVDAETYPDWLDSSEFTPVSELPEADVEKINLQLNSNPNYPGIKVLGKLSTGTAGKYLNWIAQLEQPLTMIIIK